jgi:hypothetical protein
MFSIPELSVIKVAEVVGKVKTVLPDTAGACNVIEPDVFPAMTTLLITVMLL